jgi:hypothetical protein
VLLEHLLLVLVRHQLGHRYMMGQLLLVLMLMERLLAC